jgi:hypothetical protein
MTKQTTIRALEELAKTEYSTATALDAALTNSEDGKLRKNYRKWRDAHIDQAEALNKRIKALGGHATHHDVGDGNVYPIFWSLIRGSHDYKSLAGVRMVAGRGIRQYINRLEQIDDPTSLDLVRKNLEAKQGEMRWYDDQAVVEHTHELEAELEKTREKALSLEQEVKQEKPRRGPGVTPLAAIAVAGAVGAAAFLVSRRNSRQDENDGAVSEALENVSQDGAAVAENLGNVANDAAASIKDTATSIENEAQG